MDLPKVSLDFSTIQDPYKMSMILAGLDKTHNEILVPKAFTMIELNYPGIPSFTIDIINDKDLFKDNLKKILGFENAKIDNDNFLAGWQLFNKAYKNGMITLYDEFKFAQDGYDILQPEIRYLETHVFNPKDLKNSLVLIPDIGYRGNISLLTQYFQNRVKPIISDLLFVDYLQINGAALNIFDGDDIIEQEKNIELLIDSPLSSSVDELFFYIQNKDYINNISKKIAEVSVSKSTPKDLTMMGIEFGTTLSADTFLFGGAPISSGLLFIYKIAERVLKSKGKLNK